jgi:hypothetical protein
MNEIIDMEPVELDRRRLVWEAMSDAFLDTETRWYFPRIAGVLADSGYGKVELDRIWHHEIVPECIGNLMQVAGEWASLALDEEALVRRVEKSPSMMARLFHRFGARFVNAQWEQMLALYSILVAQPKPERVRLVAVWSEFAKAYLDDGQGLYSLEETRKGLRAVGLRTFCEETFITNFRPIYCKLLMGKERTVEAQRAANVERLIQAAFPL